MIFTPALSKDVHHPTPNNILDWIHRRAMLDNPGVQVGLNGHLTDQAYADDIDILGYYGDWQDLCGAISHHTLKTKVMSADIPYEQCPVVLLDCKNLEGNY